jgi:hypothetical protein
MIDTTRSQVSGNDVQELTDEDLSLVSGGNTKIAGAVVRAIVIIYNTAKENAHKENVNLSDMNIA